MKLLLSSKFKRLDIALLHLWLLAFVISLLISSVTSTTNVTLRKKNSKQNPGEFLKKYSINGNEKQSSLSNGDNNDNDDVDDIIGKLQTIEQTFNGQDLRACQEWLKLHKLLTSEQKKLLPKNRQFQGSCKTILAAYRQSGKQIKYLTELISKNESSSAADEAENDESKGLLVNQMIDLIKTLQEIEETTSLFADRRKQFELQVETNANLKRLMEAIDSLVSGYACDTPFSMQTNNNANTDTNANANESNDIRKDTKKMKTKPEVKARLLELNKQLTRLMANETSLLADPKLIEKFIALYGEMELLLESQWFDKTIQSGLYNSLAGTIHGALAILSRAGAT